MELGRKDSLTIEKTKEINEFYNSGAIYIEVMKKFNLSMGTVARHIWEPRTKGKRETTYENY